MSQKIRAVIFDMDGVLTNSEPLINAAAIAMFKEKGLTVQPDDFLPFVGAGEERYVAALPKRYFPPTQLRQSNDIRDLPEPVPSQLKPFPAFIIDIHLPLSVTSSAVAQCEGSRSLPLQKIEPVKSWDASDR